MVTYAIINSTSDPLGPGGIATARTIRVSEGDVFIVDASDKARHCRERPTRAGTPDRRRHQAPDCHAPQRTAKKCTPKRESRR